LPQHSNPQANRIVIRPVNGMPMFDVANAAVEWLYYL
jgi:hypothetical protein